MHYMPGKMPSPRSPRWLTVFKYIDADRMVSCVGAVESSGRNAHGNVTVRRAMASHRDRDSDGIGGSSILAILKRGYYGVRPLKW
jgi:hypothetical protein